MFKKHRLSRNTSNITSKTYSIATIDQSPTKSNLNPNPSRHCWGSCLPLSVKQAVAVYPPRWVCAGHGGPPGAARASPRVVWVPGDPGGFGAPGALGALGDRGAELLSVRVLVSSIRLRSKCGGLILAVVKMTVVVVMTVVSWGNMNTDQENLWIKFSFLVL